MFRLATVTIALAWINRRPNASFAGCLCIGSCEGSSVQAATMDLELLCWAVAEGAIAGDFYSKV